MQRLPLCLAANVLAISLWLPLLGCVEAADAETAADAADPPSDIPRAQMSSASLNPPEPDPVGTTSGLPPNELGEVMVLEYHRLGDNEGEFVRSAASFRRDLEMLYESGYRPITVRQMVRGDLDLPAGTTPVVFTFDDSTLGQFYFLEDGGIDPGSMMGMWETFREEHPGWEGGATWCILPGADHPSNFFGSRPSREMNRTEREDEIRRKMAHLVEAGHEVCNHTMWHARLDRYDDDFVQGQIGSGQDSILAYLPEDYEITTFSLPLGVWPENRELAWRGTYRAGGKYRHEAVLEVTGGPSPSPFHRDFDPLSVNRVIVAPGALERHLSRYERSPERRYVSDGDPLTVAVPQGQKGQLDPARMANREVRVMPAKSETVAAAPDSDG